MPTKKIDKNQRLDAVLNAWNLKDCLRDIKGSVRFRKIKCFLNLKGGVGKSTLAANFAMTSQVTGLRTLAIDLDPQAHLSQILGLKEENLHNYKTFRDIVIDRVDPHLVIHKINDHLDLIPANLSLSSIDMALSLKPNREKKIMNPLRELARHYSLVVIDTNPSVSLLNLATVQASDELCIVTETSKLSSFGLKSLFEILKELDQDDGVSTPPARIIGNIYVPFETLSRDVVIGLRRDYGDMVCETLIPKNMAFKYAQAACIPVWEYKPRSQATFSLFNLTKELLTS